MSQHNYTDRTGRVFRCVACNKIVGGYFPDGVPPEERWCPADCPGQPVNGVLIATVDDNVPDWEANLLPDIPPGVDPADMAWIEEGTR